MARWLMTGLLAMALTAGATTGASADPQHEALSALTGHWEVKQSLYVKRGAAPQNDQGDAHFAMVLDGRHLRQSLHITSGRPFEGLGYIGYDPAVGRYFSTWMDVNFPGLIVAWGDFDGSTHTYTLTGDMADSAHPGARTALREVLHITDSDNFDYEFYETHDGKEGLAVRLDYARRR